MSESYNKLISTLQTIFEMDKADLDFGIYRIMNQKRDEINRFLEQDLLPQVKQAFADYSNDGNQGAQAELGKLIQTLSDAGMDPEQSPKVVELRQQLASAVDVTALENDVFSKLHTFLSRYYDKGDFISQRRYKADTYAIPYEGEEVKLYWANHDQYYIKSSEHLRDYAFIAKDTQDNDKPVRIKLVEADTEKDNVKAKSGEERRFVLDEQTPLSIEDGELLIHFNFIPVGKKKQTDLNKAAVETIFKQTAAEFSDWLTLLKTPAPTEKDAKRTILEKHLNDYTSRNTFDYFIHKDLGGFLNRELDFYIKNEVMHLDDIDDASFELTQQQLRKIKILRSIAQKIIRMLAQIEGFQKKLWLKKKFVVETNYCITLDRLPQELISEVIANEMQKSEWKKLYKLNLENLVSDFEKYRFEEFINIPTYTYLSVDTSNFDDEFKLVLLKNLDDIDHGCEGLIIQGDNYQALNLISHKYESNIAGVYIDPPYNTDASSILYKNGYKDSSWLSLMKDRLERAKILMVEDGLICTAIDDEEVHLLRSVLDDCFKKQVGVAVVKSNPQSRKTSGKFSPVHEYALFYGKTDLSIPYSTGAGEAKMSRYPLEDEKGRYSWMNFIRAGTNDLRIDRPKSFYPIVVDSNDRIRIPKLLWNEGDKSYELLEDLKDDEEMVYPVKISNGEKIEKRWQRGYVRVSSEYEEYRVRRTGEGISIDFKTRMDQDAAPVTWWDKGEYASANHGAAVLKELFGAKDFDFPKAKGLVFDSLKACGAGQRSGPYLDFFAGSGTTAHALIDMGRSAGRPEKYILCEQGPYMETLIKPRIKKVAYCSNWKDGDPLLDTSGAVGVSHCFKYIKLESYEDVLNNLELSRTHHQQPQLANNDVLREDYMLGYWLDVETADSPSLLNIEQFEDPFNYKLNIGSGSVGATTPTTVDLVETFNYLIGLTVKTMDVIRGFKIVTGTNPKGETVLVVWRNLKEKDNASLEEFLDKQGYNPRDTEYEHIYVNGDHTLEDPQSKVKMTEIEFKRLMFDVKDV